MEKDIQHANFWDSRIPTESNPFKDLKEDTNNERPGINTTAFYIKIDKDFFNNVEIILPTND